MSFNLYFRKTKNVLHRAGTTSEVV